MNIHDQAWNLLPKHPPGMRVAALGKALWGEGNHARPAIKILTALERDGRAQRIPMGDHDLWTALNSTHTNQFKLE